MLRRIRLSKQAWTALLGGLLCSGFMISTLNWRLEQGEISPIDLYWIYFGVMPKEWMQPFNILHYMFVMIPVTLVSYNVGNEIQTNLLETKYAAAIRYPNIRKWMLNAFGSAVLITICVLTLFHMSFLVTSHIFCWNYMAPEQSLFQRTQTGAIWMLLLKQIALVSSLSVVQLLVSMRRDIQTGVVVELCGAGAVVFFDLLHLSDRSFFCADPGWGTTIAALGCFLAAVVLMLLSTSGNACEKYLG